MLTGQLIFTSGNDNSLPVLLNLNLEVCKPPTLPNNNQSLPKPSREDNTLTRHSYFIYERTMRTRLRAPGGASTLTLPNDATVGDLISQITEKTSIAEFDVKFGYPPKPLLLDGVDSSLLLSKLDVKLDGEQLTISAKEPPVEAPTKLASEQKPAASKATGQKQMAPIALKKKTMEGEVPEIPFPEKGATIGKGKNLFKLDYIPDNFPSPAGHARRQQLPLPSLWHCGFTRR